MAQQTQQRYVVQCCETLARVPAVREKETLHGMLGLHPEVNGITECRLCPNADCFIQCVAAAAAAAAARA